jgi:hypothetical protein
MAFVNWVTTTLRASAATSGTSEQDTAVTLPETARQVFVYLTKTAEEATDNLLTVRIQAKVDSNWVDQSWTWNQQTAGLTAANDVATDTTPGANIVQSDSTAGYTFCAYYENLISSTIRVASISSGAGTPANTFEVIASYRINEL